MTESELRELSEKASMGFPLTTEDTSILGIMLESAMDYSDAAFIVALVNAYREGHLVWREETSCTP